MESINSSLKLGSATEPKAAKSIRTAPDVHPDSRTNYKWLSGSLDGALKSTDKMTKPISPILESSLTALDITDGTVKQENLYPEKCLTGRRVSKSIGVLSPSRSILGQKAGSQEGVQLSNSRPFDTDPVHKPTSNQMGQIKPKSISEPLKICASTQNSSKKQLNNSREKIKAITGKAKMNRMRLTGSKRVGPAKNVKTAFSSLPCVTGKGRSQMGNYNQRIMRHERLAPDLRISKEQLYNSNKSPSSALRLGNKQKARVKKKPMLKSKDLSCTLSSYESLRQPTKTLTQGKHMELQEESGDYSQSLPDDNLGAVYNTTIEPKKPHRVTELPHQLSETESEADEELDLLIGESSDSRGENSNLRSEKLIDLKTTESASNTFWFNEQKDSNLGMVYSVHVSPCFSGKCASL